MLPVRFSGTSASLASTAASSILVSWRSATVRVEHCGQRCFKVAKELAICSVGIREHRANARGIGQLERLRYAVIQCEGELH